MSRPIPHGTHNGYVHYACRCDACREARRNAPPYENEKRAAREWKRRQQGSCVDCGAPTKYHGHREARVSERCVPCGKKWQKEQAVLRRGTGPVVGRILELLSEPHRLMEIASELDITMNHASGQVHRLMKFGMVERISRGVYQVKR